VIECIEGAPPIVIGHSLGALIAQRLAEQDVCRAVVLMAPAQPAA
jgi:pimeloyl-ACP methyl ester carboxylesterase